MTLQEITTQDKAMYAYMEQLITTAFPPEEYRDLQELRRFTDEKNAFHNQVILLEDAVSGEEEKKYTPIGLLTYWDFETFCYVEHFAIDPTLRNGGYGKAAISLLCKQLNRPIVLEVEMPDNDLARRRIGFYQRQGFRLWQTPYQQPPYKPADGFLPMMLMVQGALQEEKDYEEVKGRIYREVYGQPLPQPLPRREGSLNS